NRGWSQQARELAGGLRLADREFGAQTANLVHSAGDLPGSPFEDSLVCGKRRLEGVCVATEHCGHFVKAEPERPQSNDLARPVHLLGPIRAPSGRAADRSE